MVNSECLKRKTLTSGTADDILISADINSENKHRKINKKCLTNGMILDKISFAVEKTANKIESGMRNNT